MDEKRFDWRRALTDAVYHAGGTRVMRSVSKRYEALFARGSYLPKWRRITAPKHLILRYHRVGLGGVPAYSQLAPAAFDAQMRYLKKHYRVISLEQMCRELSDPAAEHGVAITFDDGYRDLLHHAYPVLQRYELPATVYLIAQCVETGQAGWYDRVFLALQVYPGEFLDIELDRPRRFSFRSSQDRLRAAVDIMMCLRSLPNSLRKECCADLEKRVALPEEQLANCMLNWEQVRTMHQGGISFGSHTITHPVVSRLTPQEMYKELAESKQFLEAGLGCEVPDFAYPFGNVNDCCSEAETQLASLEYRSAVKTIEGTNGPGANPLALRRVEVGDEPSLPAFAMRISRKFLFPEPIDGPSELQPGLGYATAAQPSDGL